MDISFSLLLPMLLLVLTLGILLVLKTHKPAWKIIGWVLAAVTGLLLVLLTWTGR
jgi:uncharacterized membrane protein